MAETPNNLPGENDPRKPTRGWAFYVLLFGTGIVLWALVAVLASFGPGKSGH
jgi:hypothetical protein